MSKKLPKRYVSENAVKRALKIDSFRNLSKDKIMQFASMIPYMDKEVTIAIINQFPIFADFGKTAISSYMQMCDNILEKNRESQAAVIQGYQTILNALAKRMEAENITEEERKSITEDMISVADRIAEADLDKEYIYEKYFRCNGRRPSEREYGAACGFVCERRRGSGAFCRESVAAENGGEGLSGV